MGKNSLEMNVICMSFETVCEDRFEKNKRVKNVVFVSNFHFRKYAESTGKNHHEMNGICIRFETLCGNRFEKVVKKRYFLKQFSFW